jgi:peroxiredoxin Q/BCP
MSDSAMLSAGDMAPDFELPDQDGNPVRLSDLRGGPVVLYFYPKADTPVHDADLRHPRPPGRLRRARAVVLGVSPDPVKRVAKFHTGQELNFTLLADEDHAVCEQYGTWVEKSMYGRTFWGSLRATYIIDADGRIAHVIPKVSPKTHDDVVLEALESLTRSV